MSMAGSKTAFTSDSEVSSQPLRNKNLLPSRSTIWLITLLPARHNGVIILLGCSFDAPQNPRRRARSNLRVASGKLAVVFESSFRWEPYARKNILDATSLRRAYC